jgi:protein TonB
MMRRAVLLAALALAACGEPPTPSPVTPPTTAPADSVLVQPAPPPQAFAPKLPPPKTPLDSYKRDVAQRILSASAAQTFEGRPPEILQAVVVLQFTIERSGTLTGLRTLRSRHPVQEKVAHASVRAAAPFPAPPAGALRSGRVEVAETWLFRDDGKFQIRSLAEAQASTE